MFFDVLSIPHEKSAENGIPVYSFSASDLYPAMIDRIKKVVFEGDNPSEILAPTDRGGNARADILLATARNLPEQAWEDALKPRDEFTNVPYFSVVKKNGGVVGEVLESFDKSTREEVTHMIERGYALEVALGWFSHALRLQVGTNINRIRKEDPFKPSAFRL